MTELQSYKIRKDLIRDKLRKVKFPKDKETTMCWAIGASLDISGVTVKNYIKGAIGDGYLAEAIYNELKRLKIAK